MAFCLCIRRPYAVTVGDALKDWDFPGILAGSIPSVRFVALDMEQGGSRPTWWHVIRDSEGLVETIQINSEINDTVNDVLLACDEKTDIVSQGEHAEQSIMIPYKSTQLVEPYLKTPVRGH